MTQNRDDQGIAVPMERVIQIQAEKLHAAETRATQWQAVAEERAAELEQLRSERATPELAKAFRGEPPQA